jgi:hypothetical protein
VAGDVGAGAEADVPAGEGGELGGPQPGRDRELDPGVVAAAGAGGRVRGGEQGFGFGVGEESDDCLVAAFGGDRQDPGDVSGVLGVAQRGEGEQGADCGEPGVAGPYAVAPLVLDVVEESGDQRGVQVGDVQPAR